MIRDPATPGSSPLGTTLVSASASAAWLVLLVGTYLLYSYGFGANQIFDDGPNLELLGNLHDTGTFYDLLQFSLNGISSSVSRPLALFSFALQHHSWPLHTEDLLRVNTLIHLLNGTLLLWCLLIVGQLQQASGPSPAIPAWSPFVVAGLWLILPIQTSTVLYMVQRMVLLAATCSLIGLLLYLAGRRVALRGRSSAAFCWMTGGVGVGVGVGVLAKENAALLPLMILVLDAALLTGVAQPAFARLWRPVFLWLPVLLVLAYLAKTTLDLMPKYDQRAFTLTERLLTEARVLFDYLHTAFAPGPYAARLHFDDYPISTGLLSPPVTLLAIAVWLALVGVAAHWRRRLPLLFFAVFWYLGWHLIESTVLPLELVFQHRNYLALIGPLMGGVVLLWSVIGQPALLRVRPMIAGAAVVYCVYLVFAALHSITLWGNPLHRAAFWYHSQPDSKRSAHHYAEMLAANAAAEDAATVYQAASEKWPGDVSFLTAEIALACVTPAATPATPSALRALAERSDANVLAVLSGFLSLVELRSKGTCTRIDDATISAYLQALDVPLIRQAYPASIYALQARGAAATGDFGQASELMRQSVDIKPSVPAIRDVILYALKAGRIDLARQMIELAEHSPRIAPLHRWTYRKEIDGLRQLVTFFEDADAPKIGDSG